MKGEYVYILAEAYFHRTERGQEHLSSYTWAYQYPIEARNEMMRMLRLECRDHRFEKGYRVDVGSDSCRLDSDNLHIRFDISRRKIK